MPFNGELFETGDNKVTRLIKVSTDMPVSCSFLNEQGRVVVTLQANQGMVAVNPPQVLPSAFCLPCPAGVL